MKKVLCLALFATFITASSFADEPKNNPFMPTIIIPIEGLDLNPQSSTPRPIIGQPRDVTVVINGQYYSCVPSQGDSDAAQCARAVRTAKKQYEVCTQSRSGQYCFQDVWKNATPPRNCTSWNQACYTDCTKSFSDSACYSYCY